MALIEVKNISKTYFGEGVETHALKNVSFSVEQGEFISIMGPSGSGKSTLLHILGFLDRHTQGEYLYEEKTIDDYSDDELAALRNDKLGFVFQAFNLLPRTTVLDNVKLPLVYSLVPQREWDERAEKVVKSVELDHRVTHDPSELSGGEKQRVAIARALINNPDVIFADEPTGNLDTKTGEAIMNILKDLNEKQRKTVLVISHDDYVAAYGKRIIKLRDGEIESDRLIK